MKERLPIWFQATALTLLCVAWIATIWWVRVQLAAAPPSDRGPASINTLFLAFPISILFLGVRFALRFASAIRKTDTSDGAVISFSLVMVASALAFVAIAYWTINLWIPAPQRVRESSYLSAS
jgi:hypothetical protein